MTDAKTSGPNDWRQNELDQMTYAKTSEAKWLTL